MNGPFGGLVTAAGGLRTALFGAAAAPAWRSPLYRRIATIVAVAGFVVIGLTVVAVGLAIAQRLSGPRAAGHAHHPQFIVQSTLLTLVAACVAVAARFPMAGWRIAYLTVLAAPFLRSWLPRVSRWDPVMAAVLVMLFCVAGYRSVRPALWWMAALMLIPLWLWSGLGWIDQAALSAGLIALTVAVDAVGAWRRDRHALEAQTERADLEGARRAVLEERARIAREMHDVVAHHMSLIAVQAETAPYRLGELPEPVRAEFSELSGAARESLAQMRKLLGVLRSDQAAERIPQPRLGDVPGLVGSARQAGARVSLSMPPAAAAPVPAGVGVCAYRIVQESLSNAARHAPGAAISVSVVREAQAVRLIIVNDPPVGPVPADGRPKDGRGNGGAGHGLVGMRERVAMLGGSLAAGPDPAGGFTVAAELPTDGPP